MTRSVDTLRCGGSNVSRLLFVVILLAGCVAPSEEEPQYATAFDVTDHPWRWTGADANYAGALWVNVTVKNIGGEPYTYNNQHGFAEANGVEGSYRLSNDGDFDPGESATLSLIFHIPEPSGPVFVKLGNDQTIKI